MTAKAIKSQLSQIPNTSGVYKFFDEKDQVIYVGKAKNLYKRVKSYTAKNLTVARTARMIFLAQRVEIIQTENEVEALLLENNLIKKFWPRYNILLRDDKTFPYIHITDHAFPKITSHRGSKVDDGHYFGPFASKFDAYRTIEVLRKTFLLRNCSDNEFKSRTKPCLEYQIKRCSAPCVGIISKEEYFNSVRNAVDFLKGKSMELQKKLTLKMQELSEEQEYEKAAAIRDQIKSLNLIQTKQNININEVENADLITVVTANDMVCCYVSFFRMGQNYGSKPYFFEKEKFQNLNDFLGQFYLSQIPPELILVNLEIDERNLMEEFLSKIAQKKVVIKTPKQGAKLALVKDFEKLALQNLEQKILQNLNNKELLLGVKNIFELERIPKRIEVYDNSHTGQTNAVGALIVAGVEGFIKSGYRKFNIGKYDINSKPKDDTAMLREVLFRRFSKIKKEEFPDLIIIDGGKPQLSAAFEIFSDLKIKIPFICMSKGENRNAGEEKFHRVGKEIIELPKHHPVIYYLQRLRDEAHRFAIMTHRKKRDKAALAVD